MVEQPLVTVILPIYNGEKTLARTLDALLAQTYPNLEILAINDGSKDQSQAILQQYQQQFPQITIISRENRGLVYTLNEALSVAKGKYLMREDADDFSDPERAVTQVQYMEQHPDVVVCGARYRTFGNDERVVDMPITPAACKVHALFGPPVAHPSVMLRSEFLRIHGLKYEEKNKHCEDYGLWVDIISAGGAVSNVPEVLHNYNNHGEQVSVLNAGESTKNHYRIIAEQLRGMNVEVSDDLLPHVYYANKRYLKTLTVSQFQLVNQLYSRIYQHASGYDKAYLQKLLSEFTDYKIAHALGLKGYFALMKAQPDYYTNNGKGALFIAALKRTLKKFIS